MQMVLIPKNRCKLGVVLMYLSMLVVCVWFALLGSGAVDKCHGISCEVYD